MKLFKNYKKLYLIEKENVRKLVAQNSALSAERIAVSKEKARLQIELEDTALNLKMERECSQALRKERTSLKRKITILQKEIVNNGK